MSKGVFSGVFSGIRQEFKGFQGLFLHRPRIVGVNQFPVYPKPSAGGNKRTGNTLVVFNIIFNISAEQLLNSFYSVLNLVFKLLHVNNNVIYHDISCMPEKFIPRF